MQLKDNPHGASGINFADGLDLPAWSLQALCAQTDPEAWFPEPGHTPRPAKQVCAACPVSTDCLAYALSHHENFGVWGGLTAVERHQLAKGAA